MLLRQLAKSVILGSYIKKIICTEITRKLRLRIENKSLKMIATWMQ